MGIQVSTYICGKLHYKASLDPSYDIVCTRNARHTGDHVACTLKEFQVESWPDIPPIPKKVRQIRAL